MRKSPSSLRFLSSLLWAGLAGICACDDDKTPASHQPDAGSSGGSAAGGVNGNGGRAGAGGRAQVDGAGGSGEGGGGVGGAAGGSSLAAVDTDIVLVRFNADGTVDPTFGDQGVARVDLSTGAGTARDSVWALKRDASNRLLVFGGKRGDATRSDVDRVVVRLTTDGALDQTFATKGVHTLNIANLGDNPRQGLVDPDGKIVAAGYYGQPTGVGSQTANRIVLARLHGGNASAGGGGGGGGGGAVAGAGGAGGMGPSGLVPGTLDSTFGAMGIASHNPFSSADPTTLWGFAEAYGIARQSTGGYVTVGYGRMAPSGNVNVVACRFTATGRPDATWGTNGVFEKDFVGEDDRARNVLALPDDRLLVVGSMKPTTRTIDGLVMMLTADGALETSFNGTGWKSYQFDDRPDESFYGSALSPDHTQAAVVGYRNAGADAATNDDATLVLLPLGTTGTEFAAAVPLSAGSNDRFWDVTFDQANRACAAGFVNEGGDNQIAVARFNRDGAFDASFGVGGIAKANVTAAGTVEEARGVIVQTNGKIVVAGVAEHTASR